MVRKRPNEKRETIEKYDDGVRVIAVTTNPDDPPWSEGPDRYIVVDKTGDAYEIDDGYYPGRERRALALAQLCRHIDSLKIHRDQDLVPVDVAALGKPAIAAYLASVHDFLAHETGDALNVTWKTAHQYVTHVKEGRRP
jgi:hypothetical protein